MSIPQVGKCLAVLVCLLAWGASRPAAADEATFQWRDNAEAGTADLLYGDQPVLRYMYAYDDSTPERRAETFKVYHHVYGPGTDQIITKGPGGLFTHHRGLFVGWNKTRAGDQSYDFWHCTNGAHLKHARFVDQTADARHGAMTAEIHWNDADGQPVIREIRTVSVQPLPDSSDGGWQIDWQSTLHSERGEIELSGDRQHAGFQFRAAQAVAEANGARYIRPEGFPEQAEAFQVGDKGDPPPHINLGWLAMTYELDGKRYTVEYFEDPSLPKPSLFSERPYGRFGAYFRTSLRPDDPLTLRYRVNVTTGPAPSRDEIQQRYESFVAELKSAA